MRVFALLLALGALACIPETDHSQAPPPRFGPAAKAAPETPKGDLNAAGLSDDPKQLLAAVEAMKGQLKDRPRDFNVNVALGNLFYDNGKYIDAIEYFEEALGLSTAVEQRLLAGEDRARGKLVPESCRFETPSPVDAERGLKTRSFEEVANASLELRESDPAGAAACLAQLRPMVSNLRARNGNSWYLAGNPAKARTQHAAALELQGDHPEALFFLGALTLELSGGDESQLEEGTRYWRRLLEIAPDHPRAELVRGTLPRVKELFGRRPATTPEAPPVAAGGAKLPALPPGMAQAMSQVQRTPEMEAELDAKVEAGEKLLAEGKWDEAMDQFRQVMPIRPTARLALGMGIALREQGKPTAERVLQQAAMMPGADVPRARLELARFYEKNGNISEARRLYTALVDDAALGAEAKARLAALR